MGGNQEVEFDLRHIRWSDQQAIAGWKLAAASWDTLLLDIVSCFYPGRKLWGVGLSVEKIMTRNHVFEFRLHQMRECWVWKILGLKNQDNRNRNQDSSRRTVNVEEISSKAMLAIDGAGFDWSHGTDN
ncbi:hypothetical protein Tco_0804517 [Tanacetum coccineum]|uniref:Uncharacterized protein n=1 Tax=Tanacetum coccineum TaxID=301880 RepID=A0ABQ5A4I7_9ASTR